MTICGNAHVSVDGDAEVSIDGVESLVVEPVITDKEELYPLYSRDIVIRTFNGTIRLTLEASEEKAVVVRRKDRPINRKIKDWLAPKS